MSNNTAKEIICELCERNVEETTRHHLIPRTLHSNKWFKKNFTKEQMIETVDLCRDCHKEIHRQIPEKQMGRSYNSVEKLAAHDKIANFVAWLNR